MVVDDKGKAIEELHKKRKFTHSNESYSKKFGTIVSHSSKDAAPSPKLIEFVMKAVKVELV